MKNVLYAVLALMMICIGILFYQVQSLKSGTTSSNAEGGASNKVSQPVIINSASDKLPDAKIAFVNIDSLNENYLFINDFVKVLKNKRLTLENQLQNLTMKFQQDYEEAQKSAQAGIMPPAELENKKRELEQQQRDIENKQLQMDKLALEMQDKNDELQQNVKAFLVEFNQGKYDYIMAYTNSVPTILLANPQLEITAQVLDALNTEYKNRLQNKK
jgi:outer membrane protein